MLGPIVNNSLPLTFFCERIVANGDCPNMNGTTFESFFHFNKPEGFGNFKWLIASSGLGCDK